VRNIRRHRPARNISFYFTKLGASQKKPKSGEQNCHKKKLLTSDITYKKSLASEANKHPDFQVTLCSQNDSINVDFVYIES
jgi:hypothetical protein